MESLVDPNDLSWQGFRVMCYGGMLLTRNDALAVAVVSYVALGFLLAINAVPWHGLFGSYVA